MQWREADTWSWFEGEPDHTSSYVDTDRHTTDNRTWTYVAPPVRSDTYYSPDPSRRIWTPSLQHIETDTTLCPKKSGPPTESVSDVVTCEVKRRNNSKMISAFYFTYNHFNRVWNWTLMISAAERVLKLFLKIISATLSMLENIHELQ